MWTAPLCIYNEILKDPEAHGIIPGARLPETIEKILTTGIDPDKVEIVLENMLKKDLHEFKWILKENLKHLIEFDGKTENMDQLDKKILHLQKVLADTDFKACIEKYGNLGLLGVAEVINEIEEETGLKYLVDKNKTNIIVDVKDYDEALNKDNTEKDIFEKVEKDLINNEKVIKYIKEYEDILKNPEEHGIFPYALRLVEVSGIENREEAIKILNEKEKRELKEFEKHLTKMLDKVIDGVELDEQDFDKFVADIQFKRCIERYGTEGVKEVLEKVKREYNMWF